MEEQYRKLMEECSTWMIWIEEFIGTKDDENLIITESDLQDAIKLNKGLRVVMETVWNDDDLWKVYD